VGDGTLNDRFYRYRTIVHVTNTTRWSIVRLCVNSIQEAGVRIDTGDDTDFAEIYAVAGTNGLMDIVERYQENGAGITTNTILSQIPIQWIMLAVRTIAASNRVYGYYGIDTPLPAMLSTNVGDLDNWSGMPTRTGVIFKATAASTGSVYRAFYDWFYSDEPTP